MMEVLKLRGFPSMWSFDFFLLFSFQKEKGEKSTNWLVRAIVLEFACILQLKKIQQNLSHFFIALMIPRQPRFSYLTHVQKKPKTKQQKNSTA